MIIKLHSDKKDLKKNNRIIILLYNNSKPIWVEHPTFKKRVDVVSIPLTAKNIPNYHSFYNLI